jgi:uncharacterized protein (UPF0548 family)
MSAVLMHQDAKLQRSGYEGYKLQEARVLLGRGPQCYGVACRKMMAWELNDAVKWVSFIEGEHGKECKHRTNRHSA